MTPASGAGARRRVIGLGQPFAGDDGVGVEVLRALEERRVPEGVELVETADPSRLVDLLTGVEAVALVDAVVGAGAPGTLHCLTPEEVEGAGMQPFSSHAMSVPTAVGLARTLYADTVAPVIHIVAISIVAPDGVSRGLSGPVAAAVAPAAERVLELLGAPTTDRGGGRDA